MNHRTSRISGRQRHNSVIRAEDAHLKRWVVGSEDFLHEIEGVAYIALLLASRTKLATNAHDATAKKGVLTVPVH